MTPTPREFLLQHLTEDKSYEQIAKALGVDRSQFSRWWDTETELRKRIRRSNQLFSARKGKDEFKKFEKLKKRGFCEWFLEQPRECHYCGIKEEKLERLFDPDNGNLITKRGRGRVLELERREAKSNEYSPKNCVLACYVCNNHKSDLIEEEDHIKYFAPQIKKIPGRQIR